MFTDDEVAEALRAFAPSSIGMSASRRSSA